MEERKRLEAEAASSNSSSEEVNNKELIEKKDNDVDVEKGIQQI